MGSRVTVLRRVQLAKHTIATPTGQRSCSIFRNAGAVSTQARSLSFSFSVRGVFTISGHLTISRSLYARTGLPSATGQRCYSPVFRRLARYRRAAIRHMAVNRGRPHQSLSGNKAGQTCIGGPSQEHRHPFEPGGLGPPATLH